MYDKSKERFVIYKKQWKEWKNNNPTKVIACTKCNTPLTQDHILMESLHFKCYKCKEIMNKPKIRNKSPNSINQKKKRNWVIALDSQGRKHKTIDNQGLIDILNASSPNILLKYNQTKWIKKIKAIAYIAFVYLTATRVKEVVGEFDKKKDKYNIYPFNRENIFFDTSTDDKILVIKDINVLKRKKEAYTDDDGNESYAMPTKTLKLIYEDDKEIIDHLLNYIKEMDLKMPSKDYFLFDFSEATARNYLKILYRKYLKNQGFSDEEIPIKTPYLHWLRHSRLTYIAIKYKLQDSMVQQYAGWSNSVMASKYVHLSADDLLYVMKRNGTNEVEQNEI